MRRSGKRRLKQDAVPKINIPILLLKVPGTARFKTSKLLVCIDTRNLPRSKIKIQTVDETK